MKKLRARFELFCFKNRSKGIPNLMLYVGIGTFLVSLMSYLGPVANLPDIYNYLTLDYGKILQGEVWRLITYVFTMPGNPLSSLILAYCYFSLGKAMERTIGTLKFNLFYLSGILLIDIFAMVFGGFSLLLQNGQFILFVGNFPFKMFLSPAFFLHLSMILCFATLYPDAQFLLFFIVPIKAWLMALFYFIFVVLQVVFYALDSGAFPQFLFPLVGLANYFLFFGSDFINVLPPSWRAKLSRKKLKKSAPRRTGTVPFTARSGQQRPVEKQPYTHRCTVCGKTDVSNPELEFRYCSRCNGYFCYCQEHINNHSHIE